MHSFVVVVRKIVYFLSGSGWACLSLNMTLTDPRDRTLQFSQDLSHWCTNSRFDFGGEYLHLPCFNNHPDFTEGSLGHCLRICKVLRDKSMYLNPDN